MKLEKNLTYDVVESCGMLMLKGQFVGYIEKSYTQPTSNILIFKNTTDRKGGYKYFGAQWQVGGETTNPSFYLRSTHYGNSPETLKHVGHSSISEKIVLL